MPSTIELTSYGSTRTAASPATSGRDDTLDVTTGVPLAMASSGGSPKPSYSDGKTNTAASRYSAASVSSGRKPRNRTCLCSLWLCTARLSAGLFELALAQDGERFNQPHEILVRLDRPGVQDKAVIELESLADTGDLVRGRLDREPFVDAVVDDRNLVGSHVEEAQDVTL